MPTNKNATLRYIALDKCLKNTARYFTIKDLLEEVNNALFEDNPASTGIQMRQLRSDISFMKKDSGFNAPIEVLFPMGKEGCYRYGDIGFSINKSPLKPSELDQLQNALAVLQRFDGAPGFEWMAEVSALLKDQFGIQSSQKVMSYESNIDYIGYKNITPLFNAIVNRRVLKVTYKPYTKDAFDFHFHPAFLKQYNNRWFVFGYNEEFNLDTMNLALDRIETLQETSKEYHDVNIDWEDFFSNMIGPSAGVNVPEEIELWFSKSQAPYITTKPIHESQKPPKMNVDGSIIIRIKVVCNYELESILLSFGEGVEVLKPLHLRDRVMNRLKGSLQNY